MVAHPSLFSILIAPPYKQIKYEPVKAVETVIDAGRTIDRAAIATCARRVLEGKGSSDGQDPKHHDEYMEGRA